jgi:hypothetical protein
MAGSCEHGNELSGYIKCGEFLDWLSVFLASQEGLCSMELVSWLVIVSYNVTWREFTVSCVICQRSERTI